jgi:hypothetical protein
MKTSPVLGDVAGARSRALQAGDEYRAAVVAAVDELERAGARDAFSRVAEATGVSRQSLRTLVYRARADR